MILALVAAQRRTAEPAMRGQCPACGGPVIAKCGRVNVWHWAHQAGQDCDPWSELITKWHADWQNRFPAYMREIAVGCHRADVHLPDDRVIEFQHSSLSADEIAE